MKILLSTPTRDGFVAAQYMIGTLYTIIKNLPEHDIVLNILINESLLPKGRNSCANRVLSEGFDKLLFIDSDIEFKAHHVDMLLRSDKKIVGGTYPLKKLPLVYNFNPLKEHSELFEKHPNKEQLKAWRSIYADGSGEAEVKHIPTGFMLIDRSVLENLSRDAPFYRAHRDGVPHREFEFFPVGVKGHEYLPEDWFFCHIAREHGYKIYLQTKAVLNHVGCYTFEGFE